MSLKTATLGWGVISNKYNLYVNMPYIGTVYIGMSELDLHRGLKQYSKMALQVKQDEKNFKKFKYLNELGEEVFYVHVIGNTVHRIWYPNIINIIPQNLIYQVDKKRFITNNRVDGYMLAIKGDNEIWLKEIDSLTPAIDIDSKSLGIVNKALTKKDAERNSRAWSKVFDTKQVYNDKIYKQDINITKQLESEYNALRDKELSLKASKDTILKAVDHRKLLDGATQKEQKAEESYLMAKEKYTNEVYRHINIIRELIRAGKLRNDNNIIKLNENTNDTTTETYTVSVPVYEDETTTYEPEMLLHEDYDEYQRRRKRESSSRTRRVFKGYDRKEHTKTVPDAEFNKAKELVRRLQPYIADYEQSREEYIKAQNATKQAEKRIQELMQTKSYKDSLRSLDKINAELRIVQGQLADIEKHLYRQGEKY